MTNSWWSRAFGFGKSTLAFDTIFAEGQRRYVESLRPTPGAILARSSRTWTHHGHRAGHRHRAKVNTRNPVRPSARPLRSTTNFQLYARIGRTFARLGPRSALLQHGRRSGIRVLSSLERGRSLPLTLAEGQGLIEKLTLLLSDGLMRVHTDGEVRLIEEVLPGIGPDTRAEGCWR